MLEVAVEGDLAIVHDDHAAAQAFDILHVVAG